MCLSCVKIMRREKPGMTLVRLKPENFGKLATCCCQRCGLFCLFRAAAKNKTAPKERRRHGNAFVPERNHIPDRPIFYTLTHLYPGFKPCHFNSAKKKKNSNISPLFTASCLNGCAVPPSDCLGAVFILLMKTFCQIFVIVNHLFFS